MASPKAQELQSLFSLKRHHVYGLLILFSLFPTLFIVSYAGITRGIFSMVCFSSILAAAGNWILLRSWERRMRRSVSSLVKSRTRNLIESAEEMKLAEQGKARTQLLEQQLFELKKNHALEIDQLQSFAAQAKNEVQELNIEMDRKLEEVRGAYLEFEDMRRDYGRLEEESIRFQKETAEQIANKDSLINEYQRTLSEQRMIIEKKQRYIAKLEGKVRDLTYEIRSLLQLEESPLASDSASFSSTNSLYDISLQLNRYVEKIEHLDSPRFLSTDYYEVDKRALLDHFGDDIPGIIFIYSIVEEKFLFVHNQIKAALGWSPEKFSKDFSQLLIQGADWSAQLSKISVGKESRLQLLILDKMGKQRTFYCSMTLLSKGPFSDHVMGILFN